jgi:hypothetical protein
VAMVAQQADVVDKTVAVMAAWYSTHHVPAVFRGTDPLILKWAERLSGGDWRRCVTDDGGVTIVVHNMAVW